MRSTSVRMAIFLCCLATSGLSLAQDAKKNNAVKSIPKQDEPPVDIAELRSSFVGKWQVLNAKGGTLFVITLDDSGKSETTNIAGLTGKWEVVDDEVRITWNDDGYRDIIRREKDGYSKSAFKPGMAWEDTPIEILRIVNGSTKVKVQNTNPRPDKPASPDDELRNRFVGKWRVLNDNGDTIFFITLDESGQSITTNGEGGIGTWEIVDEDARITWGGDWRDKIRQEKDGCRKFAFKPGTKWKDKVHEKLRMAKGDNRAEQTRDEELRKLKESLSDHERRYVVAKERNKGVRPDLYAFAGPGTRQNCGTLTGAVLRQVVSKTELLVSGKGVDSGTYFWVEGVGSGNATTGNEISFGNTVFIEDGTKTYNTAIGGSSTVKRFVAINTDNADKVQSLIQELQSFHNWFGDDGQFLCLGKVIKRAEGKVFLVQYPDNTETAFSVASLSEGDKKWLADLVKSHKELAPTDKKR